ncbi:MAG: histidine kinase [Bacteroidales bacterium]|nr:histidine kinase [Bacteroidales bacterium]MDD3430713.1 histidine kinase [Bacteroidales bacterium]MDD4360993.1 histidine kinase [Bacteroidales bacterium]
MKTRGIKDLYLPQKVAFHVKLIIISLVSSVLWGFIIKAEITIGFLILMFSILIVDLEIAYLLIAWAKKLNIRFTQKFMEKGSVRKIVWINFLVLFLLFILFIVLNILTVCLFITISHLINGYGFPDLIQIISESRLIQVSAIGILCSLPFFLFQKWVEAMQKEYKLREQNLIFQNETLKNQVNPHFLFNSLNTLSSIVNSEVDVAGQFIARLSVIYRYILDNSSKLNVPLNEEIEFIRDYYYLHQIRNEGKIKLEIDINDGYSYEIIPISLQLLIENAIKHNMATQDKPLIINVYLEGQNVVVKNNIQKMATQVVSTKIGLKNLNERLRLITGKEIIVTESEGNFLVKVPLIV